MIKPIRIIGALFVILLCLLIIPIMFSSCAADPSSEEIGLPKPSFTKLTDGLGFKFLVDNNTKIVYIFKDGNYDGGMAPYYILDENDIPHMAKYDNGKIVMLPNPMAP